MSFLFINTEELSALMGLPYVQQTAYLMGIRPYMDRKTFLVGVKRRISYQSLAEVLYVEPHQGITKSGSPSRQQLRRIVSALERAGLIAIQSSSKQLILKCLLADANISVKNKPDTNQTQQSNTKTVSKSRGISSRFDSHLEISDTAKTLKADTPQNSEKHSVYLNEQFAEFWMSYPQQHEHDEARAWDEFRKINPSPELFSEILAGLQAQIKNRAELQQAGEWVPKWKYPANWLEQQYWNQPLQTVRTQGIKNEKLQNNSRRKSAADILAASCKDAQFEFDDE